MRWNLGCRLGLEFIKENVRGGLVKSHDFYFVHFINIWQDIGFKLCRKCVCAACMNLVNTSTKLLMLTILPSTQNIMKYYILWSVCYIIKCWYYIRQIWHTILTYTIDSNSWRLVDVILTQRSRIQLHVRISTSQFRSRSVKRRSNNLN